MVCCTCIAIFAFYHPPLRPNREGTAPKGAEADLLGSGDGGSHSAAFTSIESAEGKILLM